MSKRARITLDLDPQEAIEETPSVAAKEGASTDPAAAPKARKKAQAKARPKPKVDQKRQSPAKATVHPQPRHAVHTDAAPEAAVYEIGAEAEAVKASADIPPGEAVRTRDACAPAAPGGLNLGTVLKVAVVGLVVISAVLWLKRKP